MKNLTKIFMAVAVAMFAFSCATDVTEDAVVKVGGKTTLTLSLDGTRTELGEAVDGAYPVTWSEGDQITVNGITSEPLAAADAGTANATFTFNTESLAAPYCVAYPAAEANQVVFAAEQNHAGDTTFDNGAATMCGYANGGNIRLNHLTGVLKIGVVCAADVEDLDAPVLQTVRISTINRAPIAGAFNVDFENATVTATDNATSVITYNLNERLSQSPTYIHVAVPAGVYNELYVTLEDNNGGVMYATVKANDEKPLVAGKVRTFSSDIVYVATDENTNLVVRDYTSLYSVKEIIEAAEAANDAATLAKDITFVADVEIDPAIETVNGTWSPINAPNYKGTVKGNGYAINGLTKPLFNVTAASFKGLHLNVNIEELDKPNVGAFARQIVATTNAPVVENCSVSGELYINTDYTPTSDNPAEDRCSGCFAGVAAGVKFKNCTNNAKYTITQISATNSFSHGAGCFVGCTNVANNISTSFENCTNKGSLSCDDTTNMISFYMGSFVGAYLGADHNLVFKNCINNGDITVSKNASIKGLQLGGFVGYSDGSKARVVNFDETNINAGNISLYGSYSSNIRIGGIAGYCESNCTLNFNGNVTNEGKFTLDGAFNGLVRVGGITGGHNTGSQVKINENANVVNSAKGTIVVNGTIKGTCYIGGFVGAIQSGNSYNFVIHNANLVNYADITLNAKCEGETQVAGLFGTGASTRIKMKGTTGRMINRGKVSVSETAEVAGVLRISGIFGRLQNYAAGPDTDGTDKGEIINTGEIYFAGEAKNSLYVGGLWGSSASSVYKLSHISIGDIKVYGKFDGTQKVHIGGIIGSTSKQVSSVKSYCNIEAYTITKNGDNYSFAPYPLVGMVAGSTTIAESTDINIGGKIATSATVVDGVITPTWTELSSTNIYDYVVGERKNLTSYAGVSFLTSKPIVE